jgi:hypothetical protein
VVTTWCRDIVDAVDLGKKTAFHTIVTWTRLFTTSEGEGLIEMLVTQARKIVQPVLVVGRSCFGIQLVAVTLFYCIAAFCRPFALIQALILLWE